MRQLVFEKVCGVASCPVAYEQNNLHKLTEFGAQRCVLGSRKQACHPFKSGFWTAVSEVPVTGSSLEPSQFKPLSLGAYEPSTFLDDQILGLRPSGLDSRSFA